MSRKSKKKEEYRMEDRVEERYIPPVKKEILTSIVFLKRAYDKKEAHEWCERNGFLHNMVDILEDRYIFWQGEKEVFYPLPEGRGILFFYKGR